MVIVGFLILSGAVNTAIIGSNGVLNRVAEDGVLPEWFLQVRIRRYGTTYRLLYLILIMQLGVIIFSGGDMILLGEAYAFGVVWSFTFKALAMVVLRFRTRRRANTRCRSTSESPADRDSVRPDPDFPGAVVHGHGQLRHQGSRHGGRSRLHAYFLGYFHGLGTLSRAKRLDKGTHHHHIEQFNQKTTEEITPAAWVSRNHIASWCRSAQCITSSCWKKPLPKPTRRRPAWW